jgi:glycosyltransferase involved in cell wall biosynthesis
MKVVLYVNSFLPTLGGKQFVVHHLAKSLQELGHSPRVLGPSGMWERRHLRMSYPVHRWPKLRELLREQTLFAQLALDTAVWGCDVIHAHMTYPNGYTATRMKRVRNYPVVITPHGVDIQTMPELGLGLRLDPETDRKIVSAVRNADRVTAISKDIESIILEAGALRERVVPVPNGVDLKRFDRPPSKEVRQWLGLPEDARLIVTVGKYNPRKGQDYLVRAMPAILAMEPRARLVVVGQGTDELLPSIARLGLENKVVLTGGLTPPQYVLLGVGNVGGEGELDRLAAILCTSSVYVSAGVQRNSEGLSLAVLEAMAAGLPIAATRISGNTDVVTDGVNGLLVEPADESALSGALLRMLADDVLRSRMSDAARDTASRYGWISVAQRYVEVYKGAIAQVR